jgi:hypothetical protein
LGKERTHERSVAVDHHPTCGRRDEEPRVRGVRLLGQRVDDVARLLPCADTGLDRCEEGRRELLEMQPRLVILVAQEEARNGDRRDREAYHDDREVGEEESCCDAARHG